MVGVEGGNLEICQPRLLENTYAKTEQLKMSLKNLTTTTKIFDKSHDVVLKLHENRKQT